MQELKNPQNKNKNNDSKQSMKFENFKFSQRNGIMNKYSRTEELKKTTETISSDCIYASRRSGVYGSTCRG